MPGYSRSILLWGGPGALRMQRLRFPGVHLDERTLSIAYTEEGIERLRTMGFSRAYLIASWGFAPEIEEADWESFRRAVQFCHNAGLWVSGGLSAATCVAQGSYQQRDWYAVDAWGKRIPRDSDTYYLCWHDIDWQEEVRTRIQHVIDAGANGLWFDTPSMGGVPLEVKGGLLGSAGCHDHRCQSAYQEATGRQTIPRNLNLRSAESRQYLEWRAGLLTARLHEWRNFAHTLNPDLKVGVKGFELGEQSPLVRYGLDLGALELDELLVAGRLPRIRVDGSLVENAAVLAAAQAENTKITVLSAVGPRRADADTIEPERRFAVGLAEACAMRSSPAVDGREFVYRSGLTLLIQSEYKRQQETISRLNAWLETRLADRVDIGPLAVYYPAARWEWNPLTPLYLGVCQTIIEHGLPFRVVGEGEWHGVKTLIVPPAQVDGLDRRLADFAEGGGRVIALQRMRPGSVGRPLWTGYHPPQGAWFYWPLVRSVSQRVSTQIWRWYRTRRLVRFVLRGFDRMAVETNGPGSDLKQELLETIGVDFLPRADGEGPVLFTMSREAAGIEQWHLVNYLDRPQRIRLRLPGFVTAWVYSPPDSEPGHVFGTELMLMVDEYKVVRLGPEQKTAGK